MIFSEMSISEKKKINFELTVERSSFLFYQNIQNMSTIFLKTIFFNWKLLIKDNYIIDFSYLKQIIFLYEINIWILGKSKNIPLSANVEYLPLGFNIKLILQ